MAVNTKNFSKTIAVDDAYVRSGSYANTVMKPSGGLLPLKNDTGDYRRDVLLRFDLTRLEMDNTNRIRILLDFSFGVSQSIKENDKVLAYGISNDWSSSTVTYNNMPKPGEAAPVGTGVIPNMGICMIDVTEYVLEQAEAGATQVSFRISHQTRRNSECQIFSRTSEWESRRPMLMADYCPSEQSFVTDVYEDASDNEALWNRAEALYKDWYGRYQEILKRGDHEAEKIVSCAADYTLRIQARNEKPSATANTYPTRLVTTLSGYQPTIAEESPYGGDLSAERQEATGRFYTKKIDGRWWVIDPLGYPCYIRGINHLSYSYQNASSYQREAMLKKYGSDEKWAIAATRWVQDYHINLAAERHGSVEKVEAGVAYNYWGGALWSYANANSLLHPGASTIFRYNNTMPVFDLDFETFADESYKNGIAQYDELTRLFGYTTDNELVVYPNLLQQYLSLDYTVPANVYSYASAWTWFKNITGESEPRVEDIDTYSKELGIDLRDLFLGFVYDRYYKVLSTAIKTYDPDGLFLGVRGYTITENSEWYLRFTGYWCDVYCINYYNSWEISEETLYNFGKWVGKPILITEFYAKGMDAKTPTGDAYANTDGAGWVVNTQTDRGYFYQNFCLRLLECKDCIGWMYFQYIDNDPQVNSAASNKGMVNCDHDTEVYEAFNEQMKLVNENVYGLIKYFDAK